MNKKCNLTLNNLILCLYSLTSHSATIAPETIANNLPANLKINNSRVLQHSFAPMSVVMENMYSKLVAIKGLKESNHFLSC